MVTFQIAASFILSPPPKLASELWGPNLDTLSILFLLVYLKYINIAKLRLIAKLRSGMTWSVRFIHTGFLTDNTAAQIGAKTLTTMWLHRKTT